MKMRGPLWVWVAGASALTVKAWTMGTVLEKWRERRARQLQGPRRGPQGAGGALRGAGGALRETAKDSETRAWVRPLSLIATEARVEMLTKQMT